MKSPTLELWIGLEQIGLCDKKKKERTLLSFCSLAELIERFDGIGHWTCTKKSIAAKNSKVVKMTD